jgi:hypothetical protein
MSAYVQIGYNKIPRLATSISVVNYSLSDVLVPESADSLPIRNLFYGGSTVYWRNSVEDAIGKTFITLEIPSELDEESIDYIALRGLNLMFKHGSGSIYLEGAVDGVSTGGINIVESDLMGPFKEDYIFTFPETAAGREFQIFIISTNEMPHRLRKIYLGKLFNFGGVSPYYPYEPGYGDNGTPFTSDAGSIFKSSMGRSPNTLALAWRGLPDSIRIEWQREIYQYLADYPIFLYEPSESDHSPLSDNELLFGWAQTQTKTKDWKNNNDISLSFREDIVG